ncbi:MAG TPA: lysoplasmalogenase [Leadbetterella sp.]|nr:lysoplasmalogenase [Leadbetterella sp.]
MVIRILYFLILAIEIYFSSTDQSGMVKLTKPLLMPILMFMAFQMGLKARNLYLALFFSLLGDIFLMFGGEIYFMMGLGSFLIAHLFYIWLFKSDFQFNWLRALPFLIITSSYFLFIKSGIEQNLLLPVAIYCLVITFMGIFAASRKTKQYSYFIVLLGSILFIISDSLIAFNKFYAPLRLSSLWVMSTYGLAQFLIVLGWSKR